MKPRILATIAVLLFVFVSGCSSDKPARVYESASVSTLNGYIVFTVVSEPVEIPSTTGWNVSIGKVVVKRKDGLEFAALVIPNRSMPIGTEVDVFIMGYTYSPGNNAILTVAVEKK